MKLVLLDDYFNCLYCAESYNGAKTKSSMRWWPCKHQGYRQVQQEIPSVSLHTSLINTARSPLLSDACDSSHGGAWRYTTLVLVVPPTIFTEEKNPKTKQRPQNKHVTPHPRQYVSKQSTPTRWSFPLLSRKWVGVVSVGGNDVGVGVGRWGGRPGRTSRVTFPGLDKERCARYLTEEHVSSLMQIVPTWWKCCSD